MHFANFSCTGMACECLLSCHRSFLNHCAITMWARDYSTFVLVHGEELQQIGIDAVHWEKIIVFTHTHKAFNQRLFVTHNINSQFYNVSTAEMNGPIAQHCVRYICNKPLHCVSMRVHCVDVCWCCEQIFRSICDVAKWSMRMSHNHRLSFFSLVSEFCFARTVLSFTYSFPFGHASSVRLCLSYSVRVFHDRFWYRNVIF